jgi:hypothetical protein
MQIAFHKMQIAERDATIAPYTSFLTGDPIAVVVHQGWCSCGFAPKWLSVVVAISAVRMTYSG